MTQGLFLRGTGDEQVNEPIKIKACPFCGGQATLNQRYSAKQHKYMVFMKCDICGSQGKIYAGAAAPSENEWNTQECYDAINAWNMRNTAQ